MRMPWHSFDALIDVLPPIFASFSVSRANVRDGVSGVEEWTSVDSMFVSSARTRVART